MFGSWVRIEAEDNTEIRSRRRWEAIIIMFLLEMTLLSLTMGLNPNWYSNLSTLLPAMTDLPLVGTLWNHLKGQEY